MTISWVRLLLDFDACAQKDLSQSSEFLHRRDRKFALTCEEQGLKPSSKRWIEYISRFNETSTTAEQLPHTMLLWRKISIVFALVGAVLGAMTMFGLLFYDGGQRINITLILGFVTLQLFLALFTTVQSLANWQPWRFLLKRFQKQSPTTFLQKLQPALMARSAQLGGTCFAITALLSLLAMVLVQDLAFGWSTTIETSADAYHGLIHAVALPWAWLWPVASPELALVEATRFYRVGLGADDIAPSLWGQWWPFIAMLWTTYVLLVRIFLYLISRIVVQGKARRLLAKHPAMQALSYRMETPMLETGNEHNDSHDLPDLSQQLSLSPLPSANIMLYWAGAGDTDLPADLSKNMHIAVKVGGRISLEDDRSTLEKVASQLNKDENRNVLLLTRSWEPPTGELEDFVKNAQELWPIDAHLVLVPLATSIEHEPEQHQVQQWLRFANRIHSNFASVSLLPVSSSNPHGVSGI
jgi:hypothetical protein